MVMMGKDKVLFKLILNFAVMFLGLLAWVFVFVINWEIGLAVFFILWSNNITQKK